MPPNLAVLRCCAKVKTMNNIALGSIIVLVAATVLGVIGIATTAWYDVGADIQGGIFQRCTAFGCGDITIKNEPDWFRSVQALALIGVIALCVACLLCPFYFCQVWSGCPLSTGTMAMLNMLLAIIAATSLLIAVIIYGAKTERDVDNYGYSYWLTVVSGALALLLAVMNCGMKQQGISPN